MRHFKVRSAEKKHIDELSRMLLETPNNCLDADVVSYPTIKFWRASHADKSVVYAPVHTVPLMESLAVAQDASELDVALALKEIVQAIAVTASEAGMREIYFPCADERVNAVAEKHGFERIKMPVLKLKL